MTDSTWLILIRHAQTDWNSDYRFQGHADTPLNETGRSAIPLVVNELRSWSPVAIYTSDLERAREMAEAAGDALEIGVTPMTELRECSYGEWEGLTVKEIADRFDGELELWQERESSHARGGGESLDEMSDRSWAALEAITDRHAGESVAIFTHSGPVRSAVCRLFDLSMAERYRFQVDNASITVLRRSASGTWQLILLNQTRHLPDSARTSSPVASRPKA
jgi:broad specificity phosphatase PhoE